MSGSRTLIGAATLCAALAVSTPPVSAAPRQLPARLDFVLFCKTSMAEVNARLGPGRAIPIPGPWESVGQGWHHPTERVFLLLYHWGDGRGLRGRPGVVAATLAGADHLKAEKLKREDLARPRRSLMALQGPNGIRLGDSKNSVARALEAGQMVDRRGEIETYNHYLLYRYVRMVGCGEEGFILQVTFTGGRLTKMHILEAS